MTGAGGEGGPRGIFLLILNLESGKTYTLKIGLPNLFVHKVLNLDSGQQIINQSLSHLGGDMGSFWVSTILMTLWEAPELYCSPC